ncbi:hypothetical protein [Alkaliphilus hydrothermalis]|uniref:Uncharacterized protein n=1 Tax=Alkaliphilus hydrothermalis TaxID=1482730 RepID=A0ABS2NNC9_9FIRM|nr:hypothetical protein [Alkaliphilus hydrothermalis]MBM7614445.1 hypothetical protein [Alkaliphilus hydrothermalis]
MEEKKKIEGQLEEATNLLIQTMEEGFIYMKNHPQDSEAIIDITKKHFNIIMKNLLSMSEKYNNRDVAKAIGKAIMFRR